MVNFKSNATSSPAHNAHRGIQAHYRRQEPPVASIQIPQGNGEASGGDPRLGLLPLHLHGGRVGKSLGSLVDVWILDVAGGQSRLQPLPLGQGG